VAARVEDAVYSGLVADDALCLDHVVGVVTAHVGGEGSGGAGLGSWGGAGSGAVGATKGCRGGGGVTRASWGRCSGGGVVGGAYTKEHDALSHAVDVKERPGGDREVNMSKDTIWPIVDGAEDSSIQAEGEAKLVARVGAG